MLRSKFACLQNVHFGGLKLVGDAPETQAARQPQLYNTRLMRMTRISVADEYVLHAALHGYILGHAHMHLAAAVTILSCYCVPARLSLIVPADKSQSIHPSRRQQTAVTQTRASQHTHDLLSGETV